MNRETFYRGARYGAAVAAVALGAFGAMAKPAIREAFRAAQPDGTQLTLHLVGDEYGHLMLTDDGYPVVETPDLGYVYATVGADGSAVKSHVTAHDPGCRIAGETDRFAAMDIAAINGTIAARRLKAAYPDTGGSTTEDDSAGPSRLKGYGMMNTNYPVTGSPKALVILVEYKDVAFGSKNNAQGDYSKYSSAANARHVYWDDMLNKQGFDGFGGTGSCSDWFKANSADADGKPQFAPDFDLYGPVTLAHDMAYYGGNDSYGRDSNPYAMVIEACKALDNEIDFSLYDTNGDGYVDNIYVFYAGYGEADYGGADCVWPHSFNLSSVYKAFKLDGVMIDHYGCSNETVKNMGRPDGIGTFVHEFSHVMGLPDLYATDYSTAYTPGEFNVLDYGPYNNQGRTPPNYSTFERFALGWIDPTPLAKTGDIELSNLAESNKAYYIRTDKTKEYYLVENRQQTGWDRYIPGHGMLIWHVDYKESIFNANVVNNNAAHQYVDLVEAAGTMGIRRNQAAHPFPGTSGVTEYDFKSWSGKSCNLLLTNITEEGGLIRATATDTTGIEEMTAESMTPGSSTRYYNLMGQPVASPRGGDILIRVSGQRSEKVIIR